MIDSSCAFMQGMYAMKDHMSTEEFKDRIRAIVGAPPPKEKGPCVRKGTEGYWPAPPMNADPTKPIEEEPNESKP